MATTRKLTILVLEDEELLLKVICSKLELLGFRSLKARTIDEAAKCLKDERQIDAIWLDHYLLGDEIGFDFLKHLKKDKITDKIPVFVVSNASEPENKQKYFDMGVAEYFVKADSRLDDIIATIKGHVE